MNAWWLHALSIMLRPSRCGSSPGLDQSVADRESALWPDSTAKRTSCSFQTPFGQARYGTRRPTIASGVRGDPSIPGAPGANR